MGLDSLPRQELRGGRLPVAQPLPHGPRHLELLRGGPVHRRGARARGVRAPGRQAPVRSIADFLRFAGVL